jgi:hypothetical protein
MWPRITVVAVLLLGGCAAERVAESNAPEVSFQGPIRSVTLSQAQIKLVQQTIVASLPDPASAKFGDSYRAGIDADREIAVCGFVNGKRFVGLFAKPVAGPTEFLPIKVSLTEEDQVDARRYCRDDGIYLPE